MLDTSEKKDKVPFWIFIKFAWLLGKLSLFGLFRKPKKAHKEPLEIRGSEMRVWMIGHATMFINFYGTTILTDPVFCNYLPPKRLIEAGYTIDELPNIDILLISHAHLDHWQPKDVEKLKDKVTHVVIPRNCNDRLPGSHDMNVHALDWGDVGNVADTKIEAFETQHWGELSPWSHKNRGYNAYVIEKNGKQLFFCGDSGWSTMFEKVGRKYKEIEIALLPIGAYNPVKYLWKVHMPPYEAVQAFEGLGARHMIPYHFDIFRIAWEPVGEASRILMESAEQKGAKENVHVLYPGESFGWGDYSNVKPKLYFLTGPNGVGKTATMDVLKKILPESFILHDFDERGVPDNADATWRRLETEYWFSKGVANISKGTSTVICGFVEPGEVAEVSKKLGQEVIGIYLDADAETLRTRISGRYQDSASVTDLERATGKSVGKFIQDNINYSKILAENCRDAGYTIVETTNRTPEEVGGLVRKILVS